MNATARAAQGKAEFFDARMYLFHVTGFPHRRDVLVRPEDAPDGARLDVWRIDPDDDRHVPGPGARGTLFSTADFSLGNSGNRTLRAPKRSWRIGLDPAGGGGTRLAGMTRINLKSMYNDPSQMREALAWRLFRRAGVPAPRHTYARLAFDDAYRGLFSVIEQVDKRFLKDHFGGNARGNLYKCRCGDIGGATLEYRAGPDGDDNGRQYFLSGRKRRTYLLKTNKNDPQAATYADLARFIAVINGVGLPGGDERFETDAFRASVDAIMNARAFLRWAGVNVLLGSWDNYFATPSNFYLYNSGRLGAAGDFMRSPYFTFIPWDYDNCLGIDYFGTRWQYTDVLDWPGSTARYWRGHSTSRIPLVQNLLRNHEYRRYYLDYLEHLLETEFSPRQVSTLIGAGSRDGLWGRVRQAAYLESGTPHSWPFTGRQFTNDEVYRAGCRQYELRHGRQKVDGIVHYIRMRRDSARQQLNQLRKTMPRAADGDAFPVTMEALPRYGELAASQLGPQLAGRGYPAPAAAAA
jgi:CotH kinase protein